MSARCLLAADHVNSSSALGHLFTKETVAKDTLHPPAFTSKALRKKECFNLYIYIYFQAQCVLVQLT